MIGEDMLYYSHLWALSFMFLAVFRPLTLYCQYYYFGKVSEQLSTRLRIKSFSHMLSLPCAFYDDPNHSATRLSNRLNTDSSNVKAAVDDRLGCVIMTVVAISIAITTASLYCWKMTLEVSRSSDNSIKQICWSKGWPEIYKRQIVYWLLIVFYDSGQ